jgi:CO/xanthine dehydrogenase Mo-binding subunit
MAPDGAVTVLTDTTDIGTGTYTILTQVAADALDIPIEQVRVELGSSDLPLGAGSNASWGAASSSNAVRGACEALREKLRENEGHIPEEGLEATGSIGGLFDEIDAVMLDGFDDKANPFGVKGVGEIGLCGSSAAVANAVFNATGVRVRDFPITPEKVFPSLPQPLEPRDPLR